MRVSPMNIAAWMLISTTLGCAGDSAERSNYRPRATPNPNPVIEANYQVGVGDKLTVAFAQKQEPEVFTVERDGCIHLDGLTAVRVDGLTTSEITQRIQKSRGMFHGRVTVRVKECRSQFIFLCRPGTHESPEAVTFRGQETLTAFLRRTGCKSFHAGFRARVDRRSGAVGEAPEILSAELDAQFQEKHSGTRPIVLVANDYVYLDKDMGHPGPLTRLTERSKKLLRRGGSDSNQSDRAAND